MDFSIHAWLKIGTIPHREDAKAFRVKASHYTAIQDVLFKITVSSVYHRCLDVEEARQVLEETHLGNGETTLQDEAYPPKST